VLMLLCAGYGQAGSTVCSDPSAARDAGVHAALD
jgi:hypothetical protein